MWYEHGNAEASGLSCDEMISVERRRMKKAWSRMLHKGRHVRCSCTHHPPRRCTYDDVQYSGVMYSIRIHKCLTLFYPISFDPGRNVAMCCSTCSGPGSQLLRLAWKYMHACTHRYVRTYVHTYIRTYLHTYIRTYVHKYIRTYVHQHINTIHQYINTSTHQYINTSTHQ